MSSRRWMLSLSLLSALALGLCGCGSKTTKTNNGNTGEEARPPLQEGEVSITYYGQDAFLLADEELGVMIAPHDDRVGFPMDHPTANVVLINDDAADKEQAEAVAGDPEIIDKAGEHEVKGVTFRGIAALSGARAGAQARKILIYAFEWKDVKFCHLGDLGGKLDAEQVKAIGPVDVVMMPVGDGDALDAEQAWAVVDQLRPAMILPMHYQTDRTKEALGLKPLEPFVKLAEETGPTGQRRGIALGGAHQMAMSKSRVPKGPPIVYALKPW